MRALPGSGPEPQGLGPGAGAVSGTILAFDFGAKRVGVAVGETVTRIASALGAIEEEANAPRFEAIEAYVREWAPAAFVVGRPRHEDGTPHEVARLAEKFARRLAARYRLPVVFVDETLSSAAAQSQLREARTRRAGKGDIDALAAAIVLQSFLDSPGEHERLAS